MVQPSSALTPANSASASQWLGCGRRRPAHEGGIGLGDLPSPRFGKFIDLSETRKTLARWIPRRARSYSTVTDFARFRGWSTSHPRWTAM
jgi:hypothetical protein